jgi:hypothetical protein
MTRWFRNLTAAAVVAVTAASPAVAADVDPLIPKESIVVARFDVKQMLASDIMKKYALGQIKQAMESDKNKEKLQELGIDPLKDIDTFHMGGWGTDVQDAHALYILRGKFDPAKIMAAVEKQVEKSGDKVSIIKEGDVKLVKIVVDKMPEPLFATMASDKIILVGSDKKIVLEGLKASDSKIEKAELKKELADTVAAMDAKATMYMVMLNEFKDIKINPQLGQMFDDLDLLKKNLEATKSFAMSLKVTGDVALEVHMNAKDGATAKSLGEQMEEVLGKARVFLPIIASQAPQAKPVADDVKKNLKSEVDGTQVKVGLKVSGDAIGKAAGVDE